MEANEGNFLFFAIAATISALAWIFNDNVETLLGLRALKVIRRGNPVVNEAGENSRGVVNTTDPMRLPVTIFMGLLSLYNWRRGHFEVAPYFAFLALFLRLYLVGEMWTRGMPRTFRYFFNHGIRTNYFEPFLLLLDMAFVSERDKVWNMVVALMVPWCFVSLNPDTCMAALITWSASTSCILATRYTMEATLITLMQVGIYIYLYICIYMYVCIYVCIYVCMYVDVCMYQ